MAKKSAKLYYSNSWALNWIDQSNHATLLEGAGCKKFIRTHGRNPSLNFLDGGAADIDDAADKKGFFTAVISDYIRQVVNCFSVNTTTVHKMFFDVDQKELLTRKERRTLVSFLQNVTAEFWKGWTPEQRTKHLAAYVLVANGPVAGAGVTEESGMTESEGKTDELGGTAAAHVVRKEGTHVYMPDLYVSSPMACMIGQYVQHKLESSKVPRIVALRSKLELDVGVHEHGGHLRMPYTDKLTACQTCTGTTFCGRADCFRRRHPAGRPYTLAQAKRGSSEEEVNRCGFIQMGNGQLQKCDGWIQNKPALLQKLYLRLPEGTEVTPGFVQLEGVVAPSATGTKKTRQTLNKRRWTPLTLSPETRAAGNALLRAFKGPMPQGRITTPFAHSHVSALYTRTPTDKCPDPGIMMFVISGHYANYCPIKRGCHKSTTSFLEVSREGVRVVCNTWSTKERASCGKSCRKVRAKQSWQAADEANLAVLFPDMVMEEHVGLLSDILS